MSLFILNAIDYADEDEKLSVHEGLQFSCVRGDNGTRFKYDGPVNFAIGYSPVDSKLKRCDFLFIQAKTVSELGEALGQTLAQAATNFLIRKNGAVNRHLKVYWCLSDGESRRFGYITEGKGATLQVQQSKQRLAGSIKLI
jgi:hypothetical protein